MHAGGLTFGEFGDGWGCVLPARCKPLEPQCGKCKGEFYFQLPTPGPVECFALQSAGKEFLNIRSVYFLTSNAYKHYRRALNVWREERIDVLTLNH